MKIYIDADGCPVVDLSIEIAKENNIPITVVKNYAVHLEDSYAEIVTVDISRDSADYYIANSSQAEDIVVTQDYGLAAMVLAKGAICINQYGMIINSENIDGMLNRRHINRKLRMEKGIYTKFKKRDKSSNHIFSENLRKLINKEKS